ncbi:DUF3006 family protein (plasmid) [Natrialba magadii ATCC 43099]|uniref:DUF3006 family protein n=1 Tax=Natrialba magadii (strain ATCC 43099 / DSM 3394 / CCM 3739 / CIP 104546 / IAM 13178 / JCM 8861 / NBRC 102185 / NCIMB 2190 / MS3) TaxID=547559 RepID=D3T215_NATMM|nr:DUF3006 domain-containing protein [Natrialba magadii]ADD07624.1 DUF3006 family protein [Natrialba magadii ATCC 43099]ELY27101.1 hypothetical protein C500_14725 [Natrialba magadii ATCC 43099]
MTETYTATLDRIVDEQTAVLLLEEDDETVDQLDVDVTTLPPEAQHEGAVLEIGVEASELCEVEYLPEDTHSRNESAQERLDRLS